MSAFSTEYILCTGQECSNADEQDSKRLSTGETLLAQELSSYRANYKCDGISRDICK